LRSSSAWHKAHLIRDVKFLTTRPDKATRTYGEKVLGGLRRLFHTIHLRERMGEPAFQKALERARDELIGLALSYVPERSEARNLAKRFREHGEAYFRFITTPGVSPTNNLAEQAIRFVVIDRLITQGTRSEKGRRWCERIWTVLAGTGLEFARIIGREDAVIGEGYGCGGIVGA